MLLGEYIKEYRITHNEMSQDAFAKLSGISKGYISMLENNKNPRTKLPISPTIDIYKKVARAVGVTLNDLFAVVDSPVDISTDIFPPPAPHSFPADDEQQLVSIYRALNSTGQGKLLGYASDLAASGNYSSDPGLRLFAARGGTGLENADAADRLGREMIAEENPDF